MLKQLLDIARALIDYRLLACRCSVCGRRVLGRWHRKRPAHERVCTDCFIARYKAALTAERDALLGNYEAEIDAMCVRAAVALSKEAEKIRRTMNGQAAQPDEI
jgi:hypothetical protein